MKRPVATIVVAFLSIVATLHLMRLVLELEVTLDGAIIPQWVSIFGALLPGGLAVMLQRESRR